MKKSKRKLLIGVFVLLVLVLLVSSAVYFMVFQSVLSGESSSFIFQRMTNCDADRGCYQDGITVSNDYDNDGYNRGGENHIFGYIETVPKCGQYIMSGNIVGGGSHCSVGSTYTKIYIDESQVAKGYRAIGYNSRGVQGYYNYIDLFNKPRIEKSEAFSVDVTNLVGGKNNVSIKVISQAVMGDSLDYNCGTSFSGLNIVASECIGDRLFTRTCPLWENYNVMGKEFKSGENVSLKDFPGDSYFCASQATIITDSYRNVIGNDASPYTVLNQGGVFTVPEGRSYIFIFLSSQNNDVRVQELNVFINQLQGSYDALNADYQLKLGLVNNLMGDIQAQIDLANRLNFTLQEKIELANRYQFKIYELESLIKDNQITIENLSLVASKMNLEIEDLNRLITDLNIKILLSQEQVDMLKAENNDLLLQVITLQKSADDRARLLEMASDSNAELGRQLALINATNKEYADVIVALRLNIDGDAVVLDNMEKNNSQTIEILIDTQKNYEDMRIIIEKMAEDTNDLKNLNSELQGQVLVLTGRNLELQQNLNESQSLLGKITGLLFVEKNVSMQLNESLILEQQRLLALGQLNEKDKAILEEQLKLLEAEKYKERIGYFSIISILIVIIGLIIWWRKR